MEGDLIQRSWMGFLVSQSSLGESLEKFLPDESISQTINHLQFDNQACDTELTLFRLYVMYARQVFGETCYDGSTGNAETPNRRDARENLTIIRDLYKIFNTRAFLCFLSFLFERWHLLDSKFNGEKDLLVLVPESLHEQTDKELTETDIKRMDSNDQAIQTILLGLPKDVYTAVDSCKTAKEIWERVRQMMKGSDIGEQEKKAKLFNEWEKFTSTDGESIESYYHRFMQLKNDLKRNKHFSENIASNLKFLNNLQPEWKRHVTIVRQTKNLHEANFTQIYDFLKMN
nr:Gag-Pol polyprotein [Tanacetum cinerariifolium]